MAATPKPRMDCDRTIVPALPVGDGLAVDRPEVELPVTSVLLALVALLPSVLLVLVEVEVEVGLEVAPVVPAAGG